MKNKLRITLLIIILLIKVNVSAQFSNILFKDSTISLTSNNVHFFGKEKVDSTLMRKISVFTRNKRFIISEPKDSSISYLTMHLRKYNQSKIENISNKMGQFYLEYSYCSFDKYIFQVIVIEIDNKEYFYLNAISREFFLDWKTKFYTMYDGGKSFQCFGLLGR